MDLEGILAISGKPGLYKLLAQSRGGIIVESLEGDKKMPVPASKGVSALSDISIYTEEDEMPLKDIFAGMAEKENYEKSLHHKESEDKLRAYFEEIVPNYDKERVYTSDLRKVFAWYNLLVEGGHLTSSEEKGDGKEDAPDKEKE